MTRSQKALAAFFSFAGAMHFVIPRSYEAIMPPYLPYHREAVIVSGVAEIVGGVALIPRRTRRFARWWLLALLVAVFPANVYVAVEAVDVDGQPGGIYPWLRLPFQALFVWLTFWTTDALSLLWTHPAARGASPARSRFSSKGNANA